MSTLTSFYTDEAVVGALVGIRLKSAAKRHDLHFFKNVSWDAKGPEEVSGAVDHLLPPRSQWFRPRADLRQRLGSDAVARLSIKNATLWGLRSRNCQEPWAKALRAFLNALRDRASNPTAVPLRQPDIFAVAKGVAGKQEQVRYRVLTQFSHLPDRMLIGQMAKYLTRHFDGLFLDCSHAFRVSPSCSRDKAIRQIQEYVEARKGARIFTAECDIQKFFDCIDHNVAQRAFDSAVEQMDGQGQAVDPKAREVFRMYLNVYDYFHVGLPAAQKAISASDHPAGQVDAVDPKVLRQLRGGNDVGRVGVPQGGALSPLIANIVLDGADRAVVGKEADPELLYLRYCDDMIVLHTNEAKCEAALQRYMNAAKELLLPVHEPEAVLRYSREFYESKSKQPYRIGAPSQGKRVVPWVSFLGYQIHWDGDIRVRKGSLERHKATQSELVQRTLALIRRPRARIRLSGRQIEWRVALRLVSAAIGRATFGGSEGSHQRCWMDAFRLLDRNVHSETQMRELDRHRDRLLRKLKRAVRIVGWDETGAEAQPVNDKEGSSRPPPLFVGRPLSYCGRLMGDRPMDIQITTGKEPGTYGREY